MIEAQAPLIRVQVIPFLLGKFFLTHILFPKLKLRVKFLILLLLLATGFVLFDRYWVKSDTFAALVRVDPLPHTRELIAQERYADASDYLSFFLDYDYVRENPDAVALYHHIENKRDSLGYRVGKIAEGAILGNSDELAGQVSAIVSDFFVIGDVRDLTLEGIKWAKGEDVNEFTAALSAIGLAASAASALTAGTSLSAKPALSFLKMAENVDDVPPWLRDKMIDSARILKHTGKLDDVTETLDAMHDLLRTGGTRMTLVALDHTDDAKALQHFATFSKTFGKQSATLLELSGDAGLTALKQVDRVPRRVVLEAATFGERGLRALQTSPAQFHRYLVTTKFLARTVKISYKHQELILGGSMRALRRSLGRLPTWGLVLILLYGGALLIRRAT